MSEEPIIFSVTDEGTVERLAQSFELLGISGAKALDMLASKYKAMDETSSEYANAQALVTAYMNAGGEGADRLAAALSRLDSVTLFAAASNRQFIASLQEAGVIEQAFGAKVAETEAAIEGFRGRSIEAAYAEADAILAAAERSMQSLKMEEEAYSIHAAFVKDQAFSAANSINASYLAIEEGSAKVSAAMSAAAAQGNADLVARAQEGTARLKEMWAAEETAYAERSQFMIDVARTQATQINEAMDRMAAHGVQAVNAMVAEQEAAFGRLKGIFTGVVGQIVAMGFAFDTFKEIDAVDRINQQMRTVLGPTGDVAKAFDHLAATAIATQQPLEVVAKNFTQVYAAIKESGGTVEQAEMTIDSLSKALFATQTPADAAKRALHDFTEGLASGALNGRQLMSALMQAPALMGMFSQALGVNVQTLTTHAQAVNRAEDKLKAMKLAADSNVESVGKASQQYKSAENSITSLTAQLEKEETHLKTLQGERGNHIAAIKAEQKAIQDTEDKLQKEQRAYQLAGGELKKAKDGADAHTKAKIAQQEAIVKNMTALDRETILATINGEKFRKLAEDQANAVGTIRGAFTALNTKYDQFLEKTGAASTATAIIRDVVGKLGDNLNTIIPLIGLFGAAWVLVKLQQIGADLYTIARGLTVSLVELGLFNIALIAVVATAAILFAKSETGQKVIAQIKDKFVEWKAALLDTKSAQDALNGSTDAGGKVIDSVQLSVTNLTQEQLKQLGTSRDVGAEQKDLFNTAKDMIKANLDNGTALDKSNKSLAEQAKVSADVKDAFGGVTDKVKELVFVTDDATGKQTYKWKELGTTIDTSIKNSLESTHVETLNWAAQETSAIQGVIDKIAQAAAAIQAMGSGGGGGAAGGARDGASIPAFAKGGHMTVGGSGGTDTQLIAVSPGEHVTVQTPEQFYAGKVNTDMPGKAPGHFASGGMMMDGVDARFNLAAQQSTAGYSAPGSYITSGAAVASTSATSTAGATAAADMFGSRAAMGGNVSGSPTVVAVAKGATKDHSYASAMAALTSLFGVAKPTGGPNTPLSNDQRNVWVYNTDHWDINPGAIGYNSRTGGAVSGYTEAGIELRQKGFRDGGELVIPGGAGMDQHAVNLAVSPGERIQIKTPAQMMSERDNGQQQGGGRMPPVVNMTINVKDANSFGQSQAQLLDAAKRKLARV